MSNKLQIFCGAGESKTIFDRMHIEWRCKIYERKD